MNIGNESSRFFEECFLLNAKYEVPLKHPSKAFSINQYSACIVLMILIIPTVLLNAISVVTIMKCPQLKEKIPYFLVMMQSVCDLAVGFISLPLLSYICFTETEGSAHCIRIVFLIRVVAAISLFSVLTLTAMTVERYIGVLHPLKHRTLVTKKRLLSFVSVGVLVVLVVLALSFLQYRMLSIFYSMVLLIFLFLAISVYTKIFLAIRRREQPGNVVENTASEKKKERKFLKNIRLAKSCFLVVACFFLCFFMGAVPAVLGGTKHESMMIRSWATIFIFMNSSINSVIFFWSRPLLRCESFKIMKQMFTSKALRG
jgi:hypothetical protein